jgi:hypothetical protein
VCPPPGSGGRGTLAGGRESPNSDEKTYTVVLFIYTYFVPYSYQLHVEIWASAWNNNKHRRPGFFSLLIEFGATHLDPEKRGREKYIIVKIKKVAKL